MDGRIDLNDNSGNGRKISFENRKMDTYSFENSLDVNIKSNKYFDTLNNNNVSPDFEEVIKVYTKKGYRHINGYERDNLSQNNAPNGYIEWDNNKFYIFKDNEKDYYGNCSKILSNEIKKHQLKQDFWVYKKISYRRLIAMLGDNKRDAIPNDGCIKDRILYEPGFLSTTLLKSLLGNLDLRKQVCLKIKACRGTNAAYIENISSKDNEHEVLFDKGQKLLITNFDWDKGVIECKSNI